MEDKKLLHVYVFDPREEIVTNFVFQSSFEIFVSFYSFIHTWS